MEGDEQAPWKKRTGRRAGPTTSDRSILETAKQEFAAQGFGGTTMRAIARSAGVDVALIHHFFLTKDGVFAAVIRGAFTVPDLVPTVLDGAPERVGERLVRAFVQHWESDDVQPRLVAVLRSVSASELAAEAFRGFLGTEVLLPVTVALGRKRPELRAWLVGVQLIGLALLRYVIGTETIAALRSEQLVFSVSDVCQRYLVGRL